MKGFLVLLASFSAAMVAAQPPNSPTNWHFIGSRLTKPSRIFYFIDMGNVQRSGGRVTFEWAAYHEEQPIRGEDYGRWSEYRDVVDCDANTSQTLAVRKRKPDGTLFDYSPRLYPKGWDQTYPIRPNDPAASFADILCARKQIKTAPVNGYTIPQAVASIIRQLG